MNSKSIVFALLLFSCIHPALSQEKKTLKEAFFFDEFAVSINYTLAPASNIVSNRVGFGFGVYRNLKPRGCYHAIIGLNYTYTPLFTKYIFVGGHSPSSENNQRFHVNAVSIPFIAHVQLGKNAHTFLEAGIYLSATQYSLINMGILSSLGRTIPLKKATLKLKLEAHYDVMRVYDTAFLNPYLQFTIGVNGK